MKGTEKQIKWASDIKESALRQVELMRSTYERIREDGLRVNDENLATDTLKYDLSALDVVEKEIIDTFEMVQEASIIIDKRVIFERDHLRKLAEMEYKSHAVSESQAKRRLQK